MLCPRPPKLPAHWSEQAKLRSLRAQIERRARVMAVIEFMNKNQGPGWPRRMEVRDRFMDQDLPRSWARGKVYPSIRFTLQFEAYAARFGYVPSEVKTDPEIEAQVLSSLGALLNS